MSPSMPPKDESHHSKDDDPAFGWTSYAEKINGRFAMIGLVGLLVLEVLTRQDFLTWLGLR
jgi:Chlorophyll A-B binding protein